MQHPESVLRGIALFESAAISDTANGGDFGAGSSDESHVFVTDILYCAASEYIRDWLFLSLSLRGPFKLILSSGLGISC